jgi:hypothetical protein
MLFEGALRLKRGLRQQTRFDFYSHDSGSISALQE